MNIMSDLVLLLFYCTGLFSLTSAHVLKPRPTPERSNSIEDIVMESIKAKILKTLDLKSAPKRTKPKPELQSLNFTSPEVRNRTMDDDNPGAQDLTSFAVFSKIDSLNTSSVQSTRLRFEFPSHFNLEEAVSLELWLFKNNSVDEMLLTEFMCDTDIVLQNLSISNQGRNVGWVRFEVLPLLENTLFATCLDVEVRCADANCQEDAGAVSIDEEKKPFLIVNHLRPHQGDHTRVKRRIDCEEGQNTCCTAKFHVSFDDIGWGEWILEPKGYWANFCRGSCSYEMNLTRFHYSTVIISLIKNNSTAAESLGLKITCVPSKMASLPFIYENEEGIFIEKHLPNMIVEDCDCA